MDFATADLIDDHADILQSCTIQFRQFGARPRFCGPIRTLRLYEDNAKLKETVAEKGDGAVLVVDGGGSLRTALLGDLVAGSASDNGWAGIVIWGAVRDTLALAKIDIGIKALGSNPVKSGKTGAGHADEPVSFGGVTFRPGDWLYSDEDGIVVSQKKL